jgi:serine/threonine protein kinase
MVCTLSPFAYLFTHLTAGNWRGAAEIPKGMLEDAEKQLKGEEKAVFLSFVKKMLKWKPEERSSAKELLGDPWLNCWLHKVLMIN